jgi:hypothetical protein
MKTNNSCIRIAGIVEYYLAMRALASGTLGLMYHLQGEPADKHSPSKTKGIRSQPSKGLNAEVQS